MIIDKNKVSSSSETNPRIKVIKPSKLKQRFLGVNIILIEIGAMIGFAVSGKFYDEPDPSQISQTQIINIVMLMVLTVAGYGMLLSSYKYATWLGSGTTIIIVTITLQYGPLLQKFFFRAIVLNFTDTLNAKAINDPSVQTYWRHYDNNEIDASYQSLKTSLLTCVSLLTVTTSLIGRITLGQVIKLASLYTVFWNLNYFLLLKQSLSYRDQSHSPIFFDTFGATYTYLYASIFGLIYNLFLWKQKLYKIHPKNQSNRFSLTLASLGSCLIFILFVFLGHNFISLTPLCKSASFLMISFAMCASVIGTYIGSAFGGKGRVGYKECLIGTISGGVIVGSVAPIISSVGIATLSGFIIGVVSGIFMQKIYKIINRNFIYDAFGLFGPFLIASILGAFVIAPIVIIRKSTYTCNGTQVQNDSRLAVVHLAYAGITIGIAIIGGAFCGALSICDREENTLLENSRYFSSDYGLYNQKQNNQQIDKKKWQQIKQMSRKSSKNKMVNKSESQAQIFRNQLL